MALDDTSPADDLGQLQELFEAALACEPSERDAFLVRSCDCNTHLHARLVELLAADQNGDDALERSPIQAAAWSTEHHEEVACMPKQIGPYEIKRVIATGGMGTVYEAEQQNPSRSVALKVMRWSLDSREARGRFHFESEILAHLRHPGIAQVYEALTCEDGATHVPYFAMEMVPDARSITEYADERDLTTTARLNLFAEVCDAVHHAHQPPSNQSTDS